MNLKDYLKLLEYIRENNSWGDNMYDIVEKRHRRAVKYVESHFDCRDGTVFLVVLKEVISHKNTGQDFSFRLDTPELVRKMYDWLNEEIPE